MADIPVKQTRNWAPQRRVRQRRDFQAMEERRMRAADLFEQGVRPAEIARSTRANGQPAFGCYLPDPHAPIVRAYAMMVLTLREDRVSAITWFGERSLFAYFGLPRTLPE